MHTGNDTVAVVGGGTMGVGIVYVFAAAGWTTTVVEPNDERAAVVHTTLASVAAQGAARGKLTADQARAIPASVRRVSAVGELPVGLSVVIETVPERFELKQRVLREIEARRPDLIATNTSALSIDTLAASLTDPTRFVGMHFFNPVWSLPMIELIRGAASSDAAVV